MPAGDQHSTAMRSASSRVRTTQHPWSIWPFSSQTCLEQAASCNCFAQRARSLSPRQEMLSWKDPCREEGPGVHNPGPRPPGQLHCCWGQEYHSDPFLPFFLPPSLIHLPLSPHSLCPPSQTHCCVLIPLRTYRPISLPIVQFTNKNLWPSLDPLSFLSAMSPCPSWVLRSL